MAVRILYAIRNTKFANCSNSLNYRCISTIYTVYYALLATGGVMAVITCASGEVRLFDGMLCAESFR